ncbi:putative esterase of the alpha-beta hydrolase superfamily [Candidatus Nitrososphaera evergladensis SR1]|uniref:Putative esterase of the alpha-beta hydrolase superfamily n=1 Tax=Candidatus Nitrososphaera evergladensis SR1 TaxID=1459636 RepID=A0A075MVY1_9ARCH|nr:patatin-like phospholipase family protein [Candidatus Nitrososphaera evergladensis]AIF84782.1 putative esterase of the alpha-beta hydrolase superfamily [Candidatus Nitrososphaera evergladensis SR1]
MKSEEGIHKIQFETVLVMQGGGSLGAYECGVYKVLERHGIKFDIVAGTSIGAINAGIIAGSKSGQPAKDLEDFWLHIAEYVTPVTLSDKARSVAAWMYSATYGNAKMFAPAWPFMPNSTHLYDLEPLKSTLKNYIDFEKLASDNKNNSIPRLVVTATDIKKSESVVFDSHSERLSADHLIACAGYPFYGISWTKVDGRYLWDGSMMSNTPLREVIDVSPRNDKRVYIVNLFPKYAERLPESMMDSLHRARDIMYTDRTDHNIKMSKAVKRYLELLRDMYEFISDMPLDDAKKEKFLEIEKKYHRVARERGAIIENVVKIERKEDIPFIFEDADFSIATIRKLIRKGEQDAEQALKKARPA